MVIALIIAPSSLVVFCKTLFFINSLVLNISDITQERSKIKISIKGKFECFESKIKHIKQDFNDYTILTIDCKDKLGETISLVLNKK
jgi:hypothetical protein